MLIHLPLGAFSLIREAHGDMLWVSTESYDYLQLTLFTVTVIA